MNIKSTNEQLLRNYGAYKNNQLEQSNTIKNSDNVEINKDKIVSKKDSNDNYLKLGDNGSDISQLQTLLKNSGHLKSAVNGYYGKETEDAVKSFQRQRGLKETGVIDLTTKVAIAESRDVAKSVAYSTVAEAPMRRAKRSVAVEHSAGGSSQGGMDVYYLQVLCNQYGISVNTDGIWGANTEKAVRQLPQLSYGSNEGAVYHVQNVLKIPADGQFGSTTKAAVENWQRQHGLTADGIVGADTWVSFSGCKPISNSSNLMMMGSKGDNVRTAQMKLIYIGYNCGSRGADGEYGSDTVDAVKEFQGQNGLVQDGIIGDETLAKINFEYGWRKRQDDWAIQPDDPVAIENKKKLDDSMLFKLGDESKHLEKYQEKLKTLTYYNGKIDGKFGSETQEAVSAFQHDKHLPEDGILGPQTIKALNEAKISSATRLVVSPTEATQWLQILCNQMGIRDGSGNSLPENGEMTQGTVDAIKQLPVLSTSVSGQYLGAVKHIQNLLKISADGYYGSDTNSAVRIWQSAHGISSDGIVGRDTWETFAGQKLVAKTGGSTTPVTPPVTIPEIKEDKPWYKELWDYATESAQQIILGKFSDKTTILGTAGDISLAIFGLDAPGDARDLIHDVTHWENSWKHAGETALDVAAFLPIVGLAKHGDKIKTIVKNGDKLEVAHDFKNIEKALDSGSSAIQDISKLKNTGNFRQGSLEHILEGELNVRKQAVGFHYEGMPNPKGNIILGTESTPNKFGVYTAKVEVNGIPKTSNRGMSTFFPKDWSAQDIVDGINEAYNSKQFIKGSDNTFRGITSSGMMVEMYIDKYTNKIISAFPVY